MLTSHFSIYFFLYKFMYDILKNNCISFTNIIKKRYTHETIL